MLGVIICRCCRAWAQIPPRRGWMEQNRQSAPCWHSCHSSCSVRVLEMPQRLGANSCWTSSRLECASECWTGWFKTDIIRGDEGGWGGVEKYKSGMEINKVTILHIINFAELIAFWELAHITMWEIQRGGSIDEPWIMKEVVLALQHNNTLI